MVKVIRVGILCFCVGCLALSCRRVLGYGVILWSTNEITIPTGTVVHIQSKSMRRNIYHINYKGEHFELPQGRVKLFSSRRRALEYAQNFSPYIHKFVEVRQRRSLPLREKPDANTQKIYNLPENRTAKVLSRSKERVAIPPYKAYWYLVLTDDGTEGYVYGRYLTEFLLTDDGEAIYDEKDYFGDAAFESLFDKDIMWRPAYFKEMIDQKCISLEYFDEKYGLFLSPEEKIIKILTPETPNAVFNYLKAMPTGAGRYFFDDVGVTLQVGDDRATAVFFYENKVQNIEFVPMSADLSSYIKTEQKRQQVEYQKFLRLGEGLSSPWGKIRFEKDKKFVVSPSSKAYDVGYFTKDDGAVGQIKFNLFVIADMANKYDGAASFVFTKTNRVIPFLYSFTADGIRITLIHQIPERGIIRDEFAVGGVTDVIEYSN